jgi:hypothetical protein
MVTMPNDTLATSESAFTPVQKPFSWRIYSRRYGFIVTDSAATKMKAKSLIKQALIGYADADDYELFENGVLIESGSFGYDMRYAIQRLRAFRNCIRPVISGWECEAEGFRLLVDKGYIVPAENHLEHEAGYWLITDRFRKIGNYLVKRHWW